MARVSSQEKEIKELNKVGNRIRWCREVLELSQAEVARAVGIPGNTYCEREAGMRAVCHEEYLALAQYFNSLWREKFKNETPKYDGTPIYRVLSIWIMFGIFEE